MYANPGAGRGLAEDDPGAVNRPMIAYSVQSSVALLELRAPPVNAITSPCSTNWAAGVRRAIDDPQVRGDRHHRRQRAIQRRGRPGHLPGHPQRRRRGPRVARLSGGLSGDRGLAQAGGRRGGRARARRRPGTGHGLPRPPGSGGKPLQHARGQPGHQSRRRRHAAPAAAGRDWTLPWRCSSAADRSTPKGLAVGPDRRGLPAGEVDPGGRGTDDHGCARARPACATPNWPMRPPARRPWPGPSASDERAAGTDRAAKDPRGRAGRRGRIVPGGLLREQEAFASAWPAWPRRTRSMSCVPGGDGPTARAE